MKNGMVAVPVVAVVGLAAGLLGGCTREGPTAYTLRSPSGQYTATISGFLESPRVPFTEYPVRAEVHTASGELLGRLELFRADSLDGDCSQRYHPPQWLSDHVLQFRSTRGTPRSGTGELLIENKSAERIGLLRIGVEDLFVVTDLQPGGRLAVPTSPPVPSEVVFMDAEGGSSRGGPLAYQAADFEQRNPPGGWDGRFMVVIEDGKIHLGLDQTLERKK